jgi:hypothetical protein
MNGEPMQIDMEQGGGRKRLILIIVAVLFGIAAAATVVMLVLRSRATEFEPDGQPQAETDDTIVPSGGQSDRSAAAAPSAPFSTYEQSGGTLPPRLIPITEPGAPLPSGIDRFMTDDEKETYGFPVEWTVRMTTPKSGSGEPSFEVVSGPPPAESANDTRPKVKPPE